MNYHNRVAKLEQTESSDLCHCRFRCPGRVIWDDGSVSYYGDFCPSCGGQRPVVVGSYDPTQVLLDRIEGIAKRAEKEETNVGNNDAGPAG